MKALDGSLKKKAIELRKNGLSYNEISKKLNIAKSTLSLWLSDLPLSELIKQKNITKSKIIWAKNIVSFNKKRSLIYQRETNQILKNYALEIDTLTKKDLFYLGIGLFLAEGSKREKWSIRFANSDSLIIKIIFKFFREICNVKESDFRARIHLHPNITNKVTLKYWSDIAQIPKSQFWQPQTVVSKSSQGKRKINQLPYGTLHVTIMKADLVKKVRGWILGISEQFK